MIREKSKESVTLVVQMSYKLKSEGVCIVPQSYNKVP